MALSAAGNFLLWLDTHQFCAQARRNIHQEAIQNIPETKRVICHSGEYRIHCGTPRNSMGHQRTSSKGMDCPIPRLFLASFCAETVGLGINLDRKSAKLDEADRKSEEFSSE